MMGLEPGGRGGDRGRERGGRALRGWVNAVSVISRVAMGRAGETERDLRSGDGLGGVGAEWGATGKGGEGRSVQGCGVCQGHNGEEKEGSQGSHVGSWCK